jgi:hypothetical protein
MYEIGRVYIWQNQQGGRAWLNGLETMVLSNQLELAHSVSLGYARWGQPTATKSRNPTVTLGYVLASKGDLRPKNPPTGEQKIRSMFEPKPVMEVA